MVGGGTLGGGTMVGRPGGGPGGGFDFMAEIILSIAVPMPATTGIGLPPSFMFSLFMSLLDFLPILSDLILLLLSLMPSSSFPPYSQG